MNIQHFNALWLLVKYMSLLQNDSSGFNLHCRTDEEKVLEMMMSKTESQFLSPA